MQDREQKGSTADTSHQVQPSSSGVLKHDSAIIESGNIGPGTRVWAFVHILPGAVIGGDCNICDHVFIEGGVKIGDRVTVKCGVQLWDGVEIEDDVFIGPNATFTNDPFPRSRRRPPEFARTTVRAGASIGANATILPGLVIGRNSMVGAGAVVTQNVPPNAIVAGNPARISGYVESTTTLISGAQQGPDLQVQSSQVQGVTIYDLPLLTDLRGCLTFAEVGLSLPFVPRRFFVVFDVPSKEIRGEHAHKKLHQFLICLQGECSLVVDDGKSREDILLSSSTRGVYVAPMIWSVQYGFSKNAVLLVLASDEYDKNDYIRDYDEFLALVVR